MGPLSLASGCDLKNLDVLVVDDAPTMRRLVVEVLKAFGVKTVHEANDGQEALDLLDVLRVNLIISDWEMQPMDGPRFLGELRKQGREPFCFTPVIVLTAYSRKSLVEEAFRSGASHYLLKPIVPAALLKRIERVQQDRRPFRLVEGIYRQDMPFFAGSAGSQDREAQDREAQDREAQDREAQDSQAQSPAEPAPLAAGIAAAPVREFPAGPRPKTEEWILD